MTIDQMPSQADFEAVSQKRFDMGRIGAILNELDPENKLSLVGDTASIAKLWGAFVGAEAPEDAVTNVVKIMNTDRTATVDSILEDLARQKKQK